MRDPTLRSRLIRLAAARPDLRPDLLPLLRPSPAARTAGGVRMTVSPDFHISPDLRRNTRRVVFVFGASGTARQGTLYINADLSAPLSPTLEAHLNELWERRVHYTEYNPSDTYEGLPDKDYLSGALLRDAERAAQVAGKRAGADVIVLRSIESPTR
jgi:hypothetical protein